MTTASDEHAVVTLSVDVYAVLVHEVRVRSGHFESPALADRFAKHDTRMPDGSCMTCTLLELAAAETRPRERDRCFTCGRLITCLSRTLTAGGVEPVEVWEHVEAPPSPAHQARPWETGATR